MTFVTRLMAPVLISAVLSGCAATPNVSSMSPSDIEQKVLVNNSEFDANIRLTGMNLKKVEESGFLTGYDYINYMTRSWVNKETSSVTHQVYISIAYAAGGWRFYNSATLKGGDPLEFTSINRDVVGCQGGTYVSSCNYKETIGINLTDDFLQSKSDDGISFRISSQSGKENVLNIPSNYLQGYLTAVKKAQ